MGPWQNPECLPVILSPHTLSYVPSTLRKGSKPEHLPGRSLVTNKTSLQRIKQIFEETQKKRIFKKPQEETRNMISLQISNKCSKEILN